MENKQEHEEREVVMESTYKHPRVKILCSCGKTYTRYGMRTHLRNLPDHYEIKRYMFEEKMDNAEIMGKVEGLLKEGRSNKEIMEVLHLGEDEMFAYVHTIMKSYSVKYPSIDQEKIDFTGRMRVLFLVLRMQSMRYTRNMSLQWRGYLMYKFTFKILPTYGHWEIVRIKPNGEWHDFWALEKDEMEKLVKTLQEAGFRCSN